MIIEKKCAKIVKKRREVCDVQDQYNEEARVDREEPQGEDGYAYKTVIKNKQNRRTWSVVSIVLAVLSILLLYFPIVSLILGALSVGAGAVSRINLGYFDKLTLAGIIIGIFGIVFSIAGLIFGGIIAGALF